jgi:hypothetical protein
LHSQFINEFDTNILGENAFQCQVCNFSCCSCDTGHTKFQVATDANLKAFNRFKPGDAKEYVEGIPFHLCNFFVDPATDEVFAHSLTQHSLVLI